MKQLIPIPQKVKDYVLYGLIILAISGIYAWLIFLNSKVNQPQGIYRLGAITTTCDFPASDCTFSDNDIINAGDMNNLFAAIGKTGTTSASTLRYLVTNTNSNNLTYSGKLTITSATTTNQTITNLWVTNFNPTNSSTTNATLTNFWSGNANITGGTITGITDLTVADGGTGVGTFTSNGVLYGNGTGALQVTAQGGSNSVLTANAGAPSFSDSPTVLKLTATNGTFTNATSSASFNIPALAGLSLTDDGLIGIDTTSGQFRWGVTATDTRSVDGFAYPKFMVATSTAWSGTTTRTYVSYPAETWRGAVCKTDAGTLNIKFSDGTNEMTMFTASTTAGEMSFSSNNTFTKGENQVITIGSPASSPTNVRCSIKKSLTED